MLGQLITAAGGVGRDMVWSADSLNECCRRPFALAETRRAMNVAAVGLDLLDEHLVASDPAGRVDADVGDFALVVGRLGAEHLVERGHAVGLSRRHLQEVTHVIEAARADPTLGVVESMKSRQQQVAMVVAAGSAAADQPRSLVAHDRGVANGCGHGCSFDVVGLLGADSQISHRQLQPSRASRFGLTPP